MVCSGWWVVFDLCVVSPDFLRSRTSEAGLVMSLVSSMLLINELVSVSYDLLPPESVVGAKLLSFFLGIKTAEAASMKPSLSSEERSL